MHPNKIAHAAGTGASIAVESCQICGHTPLDNVLSLGYMPPPHAHDCIGRLFKIDVFGGRCLRNNTSSCLKCIALKAAGLESRH